MCGMSRDKCGAAGVAGFVRTVAALAPPGLRVVAFLGFVRNSTVSHRPPARQGRAGLGAPCRGDWQPTRRQLAPRLLPAHAKPPLPPSLAPSFPQGSDSYVSDEIVTSRAGVRVLVVNTDAEGRMVMTGAYGKREPRCARLEASSHETAHD